MDTDYAWSLDLLGRDKRRTNCASRVMRPALANSSVSFTIGHHEHGNVLKLCRPGVCFHGMTPALSRLEKWANLGDRTIDLPAFQLCIAHAGLGCHAERPVSGMPCVADVLPTATRVTSPNKPGDTQPGHSPGNRLHRGLEHVSMRKRPIGNGPGNDTNRVREAMHRK